MFAPLTEALIEQAGIHEGQSVLDVAGGTGEPSLTIAEVVGPGGSVTCTDAVPEMVETARSEATVAVSEIFSFNNVRPTRFRFPTTHSTWL